MSGPIRSISICARPGSPPSSMSRPHPRRARQTTKIQILSIPVRLRRSGRAIRMLIAGTDPFATAKPDARLVKLLIKARRFNATLLDSDGVPFAALVKRQGVSPSYFTRLVRLSYLAPDITEAILDGRQPRNLTADKLLAHSRLPLGWHEQLAVLGFACAGPFGATVHLEGRYCANGRAPT